MLPAPSVLVGGLGMGFTLRAALDLLPSAATVVVAELPRSWPGTAVCSVHSPATRSTIRACESLNGTSHRNTDLYTDRGIAWTRAALRPGGMLAVWSARPDRQFARRLRDGGFNVALEPVRGRLRGGPQHVIFVAQVPASI